MPEELKLKKRKKERLQQEPEEDFIPEQPQQKQIDVGGGESVTISKPPITISLQSGRVSLHTLVKYGCVLYDQLIHNKPLDKSRPGYVG